MKISIWQQFSSNHSADFTIVGTFASETAAEQVAEVLRNTIRRILDWYEQNDMERMRVLNVSTTEPPAIEKEIAAQYGIQHEMALDYLANCRSGDTLVQVYRNHVFVSNGDTETMNGPALFDPIMMKLGGDVTLDAESGETVLVSVTCRVPHPETGKQIMADAALAYNHPPMKIFPWIVFHPHIHDSQQFLEDIQKFQSNPMNYLGQQSHHFKMMRYLFDVGATFIRSQAPSGTTLNGIQLQFQGVHFANISVGLPAFIAWLEDKACQEITFTIAQAKWEGPRDIGEV